LFHLRCSSEPMQACAMCQWKVGHARSNIMKFLSPAFLLSMSKIARDMHPMTSCFVHENEILSPVFFLSKSKIARDVCPMTLEVNWLVLGTDSTRSVLFIVQSFLVQTLK
jgi:hypothetical protein